MKNILCVIEDDPEMTDLVRILLEEEEGLEISGTCASAQEAIELVKSSTPDLVILDHFIEGDVMGLEVAPMLKELAPNAPIVLLSGHDLSIEADREPAIAAFIPKSRVNDLVPTCLQLLGI